MIKKMTGSESNNLNHTLTNNTSTNELLNCSTRPTTLQKKYRKDAKGNLILKKKLNIKKTKHHVNFLDKINPSQNLVNIIKVESYKEYNKDSDEEYEQNNGNINNNNLIIKEENNKLIGESNIVTTKGCCVII